MSNKQKKDKEKSGLRPATLQNRTNYSRNSMAGAEANQQDDTTSMILQELRDFRRDNKTQLDDIKEEITKTNTRLDEAEERISKTEDRIQNMEDIVAEVIKLQEHLEAKITDQESRSRRENIRFYGIPEGAEDDSPSMIEFVEKLLGDNLGITDTTNFRIERAHRSLGTKPPPTAQPRSIVVKFASFRVKDTTLRDIWQKKGLDWQGSKVNADNDYPPRIIQKRKEYAEARRILKDRGIKFNTVFPSRLHVKYTDGPVTYETVEEATRDMHERGFPVEVIKPPETLMGRLRQLSWQKKRRATDRTSTYRAKLQVFRRGSPPANADE